MSDNNMAETLNKMMKNNYLAIIRVGTNTYNYLGTTNLLGSIAATRGMHDYFEIIQIYEFTDKNIMGEFISKMVTYFEQYSMICSKCKKYFVCYNINTIKTKLNYHYKKAINTVPCMYCNKKFFNNAYKLRHQHKCNYKFAKSLLIIDEENTNDNNIKKVCDEIDSKTTHNKIDVIPTCSPISSPTMSECVTLNKFELSNLNEFMGDNEKLTFSF